MNNKRNIVFANNDGILKSMNAVHTFNTKLEQSALPYHVSNTSVENIPKDADIVIIPKKFLARAKAMNPNPFYIIIENFITDPLEALNDFIMGFSY